MPFTFPVQIYNPYSVQPMPMGRTISSGESLSGINDTISTDGGGFWMLRMSGISLDGSDQLRAWNAWEAHMKGGARVVNVPFASIELAPIPFAGGRPSWPSDLKPTSDDPYFPEAIARATPFIIATVTASAPLRAFLVTIVVTQGSRLKGGETFAITHPTMGRRTYRIERMMSATQALIWPPLREAVAGGTNADFDWPSCAMQVVPDPAQSADVQGGRTAEVSILFRESFV